MYVTVEEVKVLAKVGYDDLGYSTEAEFDAFINDLIVDASAVIDSYCKAPEGFFEAGGVTITDEYQDYRDDYITLNHRPIISVTRVEVNKAGYGVAPNWETVASTHIYTYNEDGLIKLYNQSVTVEEQSVRVTYTAGYSSTPKIVKAVCKQICVRLLHSVLQRKVSPVIRVDDWTVRMVESDIFTAHMKKMLKPFVQIRVEIG